MNRRERFSKKYMADQHFSFRVGADYVCAKDIENVIFQNLLEQVGEGILWAYYDTGFSLHAVELTDEAAFQAFVKKAKKQHYPTIRFYAKLYE